MNKSQIQKISKRFGAIDYYMLYLIARSFKDSGENAPRADAEATDKLERELNEIYNETMPEFDDALYEAYKGGYERDKNHNKEMLAAILLFYEISKRWSKDKTQYRMQVAQSSIRNATNMMPRRFEQAQINAVNSAVSAYNRGGMTWMQAKQLALNQLADRGVTNFIDKSGRVWDLSSYVTMAVNTGIANASREGFLQSMDDRGIDLVFVSAHPGACPLCVPWEGQILSKSGGNPSYESLDDAIGAGLFHPNCGHDLLEYIEGYSNLRKFDSPENIELYENRQEQRYMERSLRKWKRREAAAITKEDMAYAKRFRDKWQSRLNQFTSDNGLARKKYREAANF